MTIIHADFMRSSTTARIQRIADAFVTAEALGYPPAVAGDGSQGAKPGTRKPSGSPEAHDALRRMDTIVAQCQADLDAVVQGIGKPGKTQPERDAEKAIEAALGDREAKPDAKAAAKAAEDAERDAELARIAAEHQPQHVDRPRERRGQARENGRFTVGGIGASHTLVAAKMREVLGRHDFATIEGGTE